MAQSFPETYRPDPKLYGDGYDQIDWSRTGEKKDEEKEAPSPKQAVLLVHAKQLFKVSDGAGDIFHVAAKDEDQVKKLLVSRGGERNLELYTIEKALFPWTECILGEVESYDVMMKYKQHVEDIALPGSL